jgi:hypothetical protein
MVIKSTNGRIALGMPTNKRDFDNFVSRFWTECYVFDALVEQSFKRDIMTHFDIYKMVM